MCIIAKEAMNYFKMGIKKYFASFKRWEIIWLILSTVLIAGAWLLEMLLTPADLLDFWYWSTIYLIAILTGMWCVVLTAGFKISNWIIGTLNVILFAVLFWRWQLFGSSILNFAFYIPFQVVGFVAWLKHRRGQTDNTEPKRLKNKTSLLIVAASSIAIIGFAFPLSYFNINTLGSMTLTLTGFLDSINLVVGVVGVILMALRFKEQWIPWIVVDMAMVALNIVIGQWAMAAMYLLWTANAVIGVINWYKVNKPKVVVIAGVESTGKTTMVNFLHKHFSKSVKVEEIGRDICERAGGVDSMSLADYSEILVVHNGNVGKAKKQGIQFIFVDTDALYTKHYLKKDTRLKTLDGADKLIADADKIANNLRPDLVLYMSIDVDFVQDGTRTYESSREDDNESLLADCKSTYGGKVFVVSGTDYAERERFCIKAVDALK